MVKSTLIIWRTLNGGDSLQFPSKGPARALYEWLNLAKVPFDEIISITIQVKED